MRIGCWGVGGWGVGVGATVSWAVMVGTGRAVMLRLWCVNLYILAYVGCQGIGGRSVGKMVPWAVMESFTRRVMLRLWCVSVSFYVCKYLLSVRWVGCW